MNTGANDTIAGQYKLTVGYVDDNDRVGSSALPSGYGINLSGQQRLGDGYAIYGFYRRSWKRFAANVETAAAVGATTPEPPGWADDNLSAAVFYNKPADTKNGALRDEYGLEAFWRFRITPRLDASSGVVNYLQPGQVSQKDPVAVLGLRLRYIF